MNRSVRPPHRPPSPPGKRIPLRRGWAILAAVFAGAVLYSLSPLPSLENFDRHGEAFARGRLVRALLTDVVTAPHQTWVYWEGPEGTTWLIDRVGVLLVVGGILLVTVASGAALLAAAARLARAGGKEAISLSPLERAAFSTGLGLSAVSLFVRILSFFTLSRGQFLTCASAAAILTLGPFAWILLQRRRRAVPAVKPESSPSETETIGSAWLWLAAPLLVVIVLGGFLPPLEFDVLAYHLQAPKEFFQQGRVGFLPHNVYANMPLGSEMFALLAMHVTGDGWTGGLVGKTILAAYSLATGLAVLAFGQRLGGASVGVVAAVLYISTPWTIRIANLGLNENGLALFAVLTAHAAHLWTVVRRIELLVLAGFFAGSAASIKYTGLLFVAAPLVLAVVFVAWRETSLGSLRRRGLASFFGVVALAIAAGCWPWYAANWWHTDNPVYPLLGDWFGNGSRGSELVAQWHAAHRPPNLSPRDLLGGLADFAWRSEWHNPLLLALAAITLLFLRSRWKYWLAAYLAYYFAAWWLLTHRLDRFWAPAIPAMALLAGGAATVGAGRFGRSVVQWSLAAWVAICLLWAVHPASLCGYTRLVASYDWLRNDPARVPLWRQNLNELAGRDEAVLAVGDAAVFDLDARVYYNTVFDPWLLHEWLGDSSEAEQQSRALYAELIARNIGYVYVHWGELDRYRRTYDRESRRSEFITPQLFDRLVSEGVLTPLATRLAGANVSLFRVVPRAEEERNANPH